MAVYNKATAYHGGKEINAIYHQSKRIDYEFQNEKQIYSYYYPKGMEFFANKINSEGQYYQSENKRKFKYAPYAYLVNTSKHRYIDFDFLKLASVSQIELTGLSLQASSHWGTGTNPTEIDGHTWYTYRCRAVPLTRGKYDRTILYQYKYISTNRLKDFMGQCNQVGGLDNYALDIFNSNNEKINTSPVSVRLVGFDTGIALTLEYLYGQSYEYDYLTVTNIKILSNYMAYE